LLSKVTQTLTDSVFFIFLFNQLSLYFQFKFHK
jgi:hypothetical protein